MFREIFPNVFLFQSNFSGSNVFLLTGKRIALIDSGSSDYAVELKNSLEKAGIDCNKVELVLHTHGHADHFGCDFLFKNAKIIMHKFDAKFVNEKDFDFTAAGIIETKHFPKINSFFREKEIIDLKNFKLKVIFTPGHTAGSVCFFDSKKGFLFSGDTLFEGSFGRFDLPSGNRKELFNSIKKISGLKFNFLLPGHGGILNGSQKENIQSALESLNQEFL